jgi:hypothetical protein
VVDFDFLTAGVVYYGNVSLGGIKKHAMHFYVVLTVDVLEYKSA